MVDLPSEKPAYRRASLGGALREAVEERLYDLRERVGAARHVRATVRWIRGTSRQGDLPLTLLYFGSGQSLSYLLDKLFAESAEVRRVDGCWIASAARWVARPGEEVDLVVVDLPWPYDRWMSSVGYLRIPGWIVQKLPLGATWEEVLGSFRRNTRSTDLRKVRRHQLHYRLTRSVSDLEHFYDTMYEPYAERRFGSLALVDSREEIVGFGARGWLLQVLEHERVVGGVVLFPWRGSMHFLWIGLPDDLDPRTFDAAFSGIYYFSIQHAYLEGCHEIDLSYTRPLLENGIYRYKRKWGARLHDDWKLGEIRLRPLNLGPAVEAALVGLPLVVRGEGGLVGKVLLDRETAASPEGLRERVARYASGGMTTLELCSLHPLATDAVGGEGVRVRSLADCADPAAAFCS